MPLIRTAPSEDLAGLPALEAAADRLLESALGRLLPAHGQDLRRDAARGPVADAGPGPAVEPLFILVAVPAAGAPPVAFARVDELEGQAHLEQLSVHPQSARQGIGRSLVQAALHEARRRGYACMTLCTFAEVPFNGPFYASCGFEAVAEPAGALAALRASEARLGLDDLGARTAMRIRL